MGGQGVGSCGGRWDGVGAARGGADWGSDSWGKGLTRLQREVAELVQCRYPHWLLKEHCIACMAQRSYTSTTFLHTLDVCLTIVCCQVSADAYTQQAQQLKPSRGGGLLAQPRNHCINNRSA